MCEKMVFDATVLKLEDLDLFRKKKILMHFVNSKDMGTEGETIVVSTLEGDVAVTINNKVIIMIGAYKDAYPISEEIFRNRYERSSDKWDEQLEWFIQKYNVDKSAVHSCILKNDVLVYAKKMTIDFKVFNRNNNCYLFGKKGDYYVVTGEDISNIYIIQGIIMDNTYEKVN